ncbi:hypothetical protein L211DRAFT_836894 [Terfezia boudieri ATCC MYA-4762]|uniref:Uncharacterized protein n=1 Tax=Terfezia boudieri ATCC MYA-4762 TaxID=1051890 RepID=A0A3N4LTN3_9PEZI|nr:hypothetical protein L211DRAFT_836894 [Terfezia boudieri ATCC MYA-4762]
MHKEHGMVCPPWLTKLYASVGSRMEESVLVSPTPSAYSHPYSIVMHPPSNKSP